MIGDGESQEGEIWEGAMFAAHHKLSNLCGILDYNKLQSDDWNENIIGIEPIRDKWEAFGWNVLEIDGHNISQIKVAFSEATLEEAKPTMIVAHTIKGKGVSFMENVPSWHGSVKLSDEDFEAALLELGATKNEIEIAIHG